MKVVGTNLIAAYMNGCTVVKAADVQNWQSLTRAANWMGPTDVRLTFPAGRNPVGNHWEFPMPRSTAMVEAIVSYRKITVLVTKVT